MAAKRSTTPTAPRRGVTASSADTVRAVVPSEGPESESEHAAAAVPDDCTLQALLPPRAEGVGDDPSGRTSVARRWGRSPAVLTTVALVALLLGGGVGVALARAAAARSLGTAAASSDAVALFAFNKHNVVCGFHAGVCDCGWASGGREGSCSLGSNDKTSCWSCCCRHYHAEDYHRYVAETHRSSGAGGFYDGSYHHHGIHRGDNILVQTPREDWRYARCLGLEGPHHLRVQFADDQRIATVPTERVVLVEETGPWYWYFLMALTWIVLCLVCAGCIGLTVKALRGSSFKGDRLFSGRNEY